MGWINPNAKKERLAAQRAWQLQQNQKAHAKRMALADKIVMAVVDKIAHDIIRPGPKPEERECYVMAQELRDSGIELKQLVSNILKVHVTEEGL